MSNSSHNSRTKIAVAGASGFVGTHLRDYLSEEYDFRALTRSTSVVEAQSSSANTEWRLCDLYSLPKLTEAMHGCDFGIYLVHSMAPSSRLIQASFEDTDLLLADNFIRAAEAAGLRHVIYLSGLLPETEEELSPHLRSRREVEKVLRSRTVKVTVLRAGLICGPGGSSFSMLVNLVRRLPIMFFPRWANSMTQSIDIKNICEAFAYCFNDSSLAGGVYDLGGHEPMSYRELIVRTARVLDRPIYIVNFTWNCFRISKHWVAFFGGVPTALVGPLQESLRHNLKARPNPLLDKLQATMVDFDQSILRSVDDKGMPKANPRSETQSTDTQQIRKLRLVRSVQRMALVTKLDARAVAEEYASWLTKTFRGLIRVEQTAKGVITFIGLKRYKLLELTPTPYTVDNKRRCAFYVTGGLLSRSVEPPGRLEFRLVPQSECLIASIHGFAPRLPWWIYASTQARVHLAVMHAFGRHLKRLHKD
ncbi:MAG: NAD(P)H-binding protein [Verrucomicrobiota bacterium]|nr:NAD(P)H-binding protein [Verrucomicrobiota bacterium]